MATHRARTASELVDVAKAARDMEFRFDGIVRNEAVRRVEIPLRLKRIGRSGTLRLRGVRGFAVEGRRAQETDGIRSMGWDGAARRLVIECAPSRLVIDMDGLDVELDDGVAAAGQRNLDHLPAAARTAFEAHEESMHARRARHEEVRRTTERNVALLAGTIALGGGFAFGNPWWALALNGLTGGGAGFLVVRKRIDTPALGALLLAVPAMLLSLTGEMCRVMTTSAGMLGAVFFGLWIAHLIAGAFLSMRLAIPRDGDEGLPATVDWQDAVRPGLGSSPGTPATPPAFDGGAAIPAAALRKAMAGTAVASFLLCVLLRAHPAAMALVTVPAVAGGTWLCVRKGLGPGATAALFTLPLVAALWSSGGVPTGWIGTLFLAFVHAGAGFALPGWPAYERGRRR